ncbi:unnamed protein product [Adineta steineri]|uniref:Uncharacterized protein n=1 Tax=Adineta steineri TaxID=433720 RepID=A0A819WU72_9BILA|nr:unnamed protein product [Adineta steineri]CAF4128980.1 unnamed protein product [Adineta steineri]
MIFNNLKERITKETSQKRNYNQFIVDINSVSELKQNTIKNENFQNYLIEFIDLFECIIVDSIEANINKNEILFHVLENYTDIFYHFRFCHEKIKGFIDGHSFKNQIKSFLLKQNIQYIVIYGIFSIMV